MYQSDRVSMEEIFRQQNKIYKRYLKNVEAKMYMTPISAHVIHSASLNIPTIHLHKTVNNISAQYGVMRCSSHLIATAGAASATLPMTPHHHHHHTSDVGFNSSYGKLCKTSI
ncbi:uncharacterized protein LOC125027557 [Penaeus chinensis]|uniref:uncharacterized protein LOC125027557 n=1 Tax=Penaeus chinensis TaxID=139456 RepID=UPI001FB83D80|nr:uncharacterized protein LOC125027557 [Penaeus chinensis]